MIYIYIYIYVYSKSIYMPSLIMPSISYTFSSLQCQVLSVKWDRVFKHYKIFYVEDSGFSVGGDCVVFFSSPVRSCHSITEKDGEKERKKGRERERARARERMTQFCFSL